MLDLPADHPRTGQRPEAEARFVFCIPEQQAAALAQVGQGTLSTTLLAAFQVLLYRHTGQSDLSVAVPEPAVEPGTRDAGGLIVVRTDLSREPRFLEHVERVQVTWAEAHAHGPAPLAALSEAGISLPQAMFALSPPPEPAADLLLCIERTTDGWRGTLHADSHLFAAVALQRLAGHYLQLLQGIAACPEQRISALTLLSPAERHQALVEWNDIPEDRPEQRTLHGLFEAQAARRGDAPALLWGERRLSYAELDAAANRLAHHLRSLGVATEVRVGICTPRAPEMVIGVLGVLKAGGTYVFLDPEYPPERQQLMLADASGGRGGAVLLTVAGLAESLADCGGLLLCLDADWERIARHSAEPLGLPVDPDHLAYLIYTSGSTGRPKAVAISHGSAAAQVAWGVRAFPVRELAGVLSSSSLSFDMSIFELFVTFAAGGRVVLARDVRELATLPAAHEVTLVNTVPSAMAELVRATRLPASLRTVNLCGEPLRGDLAAAIYSTPTVERVVNLYGPTETTVYATLWEVPRDLEGEPAIGRPIGNNRAYVMDARGELVPAGAPGELWLGGTGPARGYLDHPSATAERFIPDPFSGETGSRLFRTGDLVRQRWDGTLEFIGRIDRQIKVRGFRIEPGEIEMALTRHPGVVEAAVAVWEDPVLGKRLAAYVVTMANGSSPTETELREDLKERLPAHMVPADFFFLSALPRLPNGKVDRRSLRPPERRGPQRASAPAAPPTGSPEQILAALWAELLNVEQVQGDDDFFSLGGDSLLALRLVARAREMGLVLDLRQLTQRLSLAELALSARPAAGSTTDQPAAGPVPLLPGQVQFFQEVLSDPHHNNLTILLAAPPRLDCDALRESLRLLPEHHEALSHRFVRGDSGWRQLFAGLVSEPPLTQVDLSALPRTVHRQALEEASCAAQGSLRLSDGVLLRLVAFDFGAGTSGRLLVLGHHLVLDQIAFDIVLEDLDTLYGQLSRGEPVRLPAKTSSLPAWSRCLAAHVGSGAMAQELEWWVSRPWRRAAPVPLDEAGPAQNSWGSSRTINVELAGAPVMAALHDLIRGSGITIEEMLLATLAHALAGWSGCSAQLVELIGHGRESSFPGFDLTRTVGDFTVNYPVLVDLQGVQGAVGTLEAVAAELRQVPNKGRSFPLLRYLDHGPAMSARIQSLPIPEVALNYHGRLARPRHRRPIFQSAPESPGPRSPMQGLRSRVFVIEARWLDSGLRMDWHYSKNLHHRTTMEGLSERCRDFLCDLLHLPRAGHQSRAR